MLDQSSFSVKRDRAREAIQRERERESERERERESKTFFILLSKIS